MQEHDKEQLIQTLRQRFLANPQRHPGLAWSDVQARLEANPRALATLQAMEASGGEPDVVVEGGAADGGSEGQVAFYDCAAESPVARRSLCYDRPALDARKENKPLGNAVEQAAAMGASLLTEAQYRALQAVGEFDLKTSSWLATPGEVRALGGALFGDRRFGRVFVYHNGVQSYYSGRGFRAVVRV